MTKEQQELMEFINTPEYLARRAKEQADHRAATEKAHAEAARIAARMRAQREKQDREREEAVRPLKEALKAAGIKLECDGYYDGAWLKYQIGNGPVVEIEEGLDAFEDD
jgi:hypothetical protein